MRSLLRLQLTVAATLTLIATSAGTAGARETEPPRSYEVAPTMATTSVLPDEPMVATPSPAPRDATAEVRDTDEPGRRFYGWQNIAVGYAGLAMIATTMSKGGALPWFGLGIYGLGGPIVHVAHEEYGRAAGSLVLNVLTPILVGALAHSMDKGCAGREECSFGDISGAIGGVVVGMLAAPIIDGLAMGWEDAPRKPPPELAVQPTLTVARKEPNGASTTMIGLAGVF